MIGGYAVGFYGAPRFTADMDVWIGADTTNSSKMGLALGEFGIQDPEVLSGGLHKPNSIFRIGRPPLQIDILTEISGREFSECYERREVLLRDGIEISVISLSDLKSNKQASGRAKDLGDLEALD